MKNAPLPIINGIKPSYLNLPHDAARQGTPLLGYLCERFPFIGADIWRRRLNSGMVVDSQGTPLNEHALFQAGSTLFYYREVSRDSEPRIPFSEQIVWHDKHLIIADKPHFLPVTPSGRFLHETLLTRLRLRPDLQHLNPEHITPIHRLDKDTAGIVLFSCNPDTRAAYHDLFHRKAIRKTYHALAATRTDLAYPLTVRSRLERGDPFFTTRETVGEPNSCTQIELLQTHGSISLYRLTPITGKKHQLRVHMMQLGMPLLNDPLYPTVQQPEAEDYSKPLQLLAKRIEFSDPITGEMRVFESRQNLNFQAA